MRIQCDDDLYRVDRVFLGPKGKPWPFRATYRALVLTAGLLFLGVTVWRAVHLPFNTVILVAIGIGAYLGAQALDKRLTVDRPVLGEAQRIWQELTAPRPDVNPRAVTTRLTVDIPRWGPGAHPAKKRWRQGLSSVQAGSSRLLSTATGKPRGRVFIEGSWRDVH